MITIQPLGHDDGEALDQDTGHLQTRLRPQLDALQGPAHHREERMFTFEQRLEIGAPQKRGEVSDHDVAQRGIYMMPQHLAPVIARHFHVYRLHGHGLRGRADGRGREELQPFFLAGKVEARQRKRPRLLEHRLGVEQDGIEARYLQGLA